MFYRVSIIIVHHVHIHVDSPSLDEAFNFTSLAFASCLPNSGPSKQKDGESQGFPAGSVGRISGWDTDRLEKLTSSLQQLFEQQILWSCFSMFCASDPSGRQHAGMRHNLTMLAGATLPKEEVPQGRGGRVAGTETGTMRLLTCRNHWLEAWVLVAAI